MVLQGGWMIFISQTCLLFSPRDSLLVTNTQNSLLSFFRSSAFKYSISTDQGANSPSLRLLVLLLPKIISRHTKVPKMENCPTFYQNLPRIPCQFKRSFKIDMSFRICPKVYLFLKYMPPLLNLLLLSRSQAKRTLSAAMSSIVAWSWGEKVGEMMGDRREPSLQTLAVEAQRKPRLVGALVGVNHLSPMLRLSGVRLWEVKLQSMLILRVKYSLSAVKTRFLQRLEFQPTVFHLRHYLYSYLLASNTGGSMEIIFDDSSAKNPAKKAQVFQGFMDWLRIGEGQGAEKPRMTGEFKQHYVRHFKQLVDKNQVYLCFCEQSNKAYDGTCRNLSLEDTKKFLEAKRPYRVRLKQPEASLEYQDLVYGKVTEDPREDPVIEDPLTGITPLFKAVVIDKELQITHLFHNAETMKQLNQYLTISKVLGTPLPNFIALPLLVNHNVRSLPLSELKKEGYEPEAVLNFVSLLGWRPFGDAALNAMKDAHDFLFDKEDLVKYFDVDKISKRPVQYKVDKLKILNQMHLRRSLKESPDVEDFRERLNSLFGDSNIDKYDDAYLQKALSVISQNIKKSTGLIDFKFMFSPDFPRSKLSLTTELQTKINNNIYLILKHILSPEEFTQSEFAKRLGEFLQDHHREIPPEALYKYLKYCVSGQPNGKYSALEVCGLLGHQEVLSRVVSCRQESVSDVALQ